MAEGLGDRVGRWITLNEPVVVTWNGHVEGSHAPGLRLGSGAFPVAHHQLLGHGLAVPALRAATPGVPVGITNNYGPVRPATPAEADVQVAAFRDALHNHLYTDPVLLARYPDLVAPLTGDTVRDGDLATIAAPIDFLGVNYYFPELVRADPEATFGMAEVEFPAPSRTAFDWPVVPAGLTETLTALRDRYGAATPPLYVTENGAAYDDAVGPDGARARPGPGVLSGRSPARGAGGDRRRRRRARLLLLVAAGQLRVGRGLLQAVRAGARRLRHARPHAEGLVRLVPRPRRGPEPAGRSAAVPTAARLCRRAPVR